MPHKVQRRKRETTEIMASIISILLEGKLRKTRIGHKLNLDSRAVGRYVKLLLDLGLIARSLDDKSCYVSTLQGQEFVLRYSALIQATDSLAKLTDTIPSTLEDPLTKKQRGLS